MFDDDDDINDNDKEQNLTGGRGVENIVKIQSAHC